VIHPYLICGIQCLRLAQTSVDGNRKFNLCARFTNEAEKHHSDFRRVGLASVIFALPELLALIPGWRDMAFDLSSAGTTG
jgi:hypothetical protein